jgi:5-hydroxyisourate hydrolase
LSGLSTHVLNTASGSPAIGLAVSYQVLEDSAWREVCATSTDDDGRIRDLLAGTPLIAGSHRLVFSTGEWFGSQNIDSFFPVVAIDFRITDPSKHHHVPLLLSPFSYSTYRGS